jgi:arginine/ornithine permease
MVFCVSILIFLAFDPTQLVGLLVGLAFLITCYLFYYMKNKKKEEGIPETEINPL